MFPELHALFFDAAGTLLRLRHPVGVGYAKIAAQHGIRLPPQALEYAFRAQWKQMPPQNPGAPLADDGRSWWRQLVFAVLDRLETAPPIPAPNREAFFDQLYAFYALPEAWEPFPEVHEVLTRLNRQDHYTLGVISNWDGRLHHVLEGLGLAPFFDHIVISSEIGFSKPHPRIFELACRKSGYPAHQCLLVGDDPEADWQGAKRAGMQVFPLDRKTGDLTQLIKPLTNPPD